jgi:phosphoribosylglycinamide formyltransferase 1
MKKPSVTPVKLAVLLSGGGTTLQNIIDNIEAKRLSAEVAVVISSRSSVKGLERAENHGIPHHVVSRKECGNTDTFSTALNNVLEEYQPDLVCMAGFMSLWRFPDKYQGKVMNIHPALIPAFCGKGFWGHLVHQGVIDYGAKVSGATVHFADLEYDTGPIIVQRTVPVLEDDTADTLAERVHGAENEVYPEAIQLFAEGRLQIEGRRVRILKRNQS